MFRAATIAAALAVAPHPLAAQEKPRSEAWLADGLTDPARKAEATAYLESHPDAVQPIYLGILSSNLFARGDRLRAAYWFYVFQIRSRPWADADQGGVGALRASLNAALGETINGWLGSDLAAFKATARRAMADEPNLPLYKGKPAGVSDPAWRASVAAARKNYVRDGEAALGLIDAATWNAGRQRNGLRVGPLDGPGRPLP